MKKIFITGGSGFLGGHLIDYFLSNPEFNDFQFVFSSCKSSLPSQGKYKKVTLNITDSNAVMDTLKNISPDLIIHTAAITNANQCFENKDFAYRVNVMGTENIVRAAKEINARVIYTSTDLIFQGDRSFCSEEDAAVPICYYGKTKLEGEQVVKSNISNYMILRVALMYGISYNSYKTFFETLIINLRKKRKTNLFVDEFRTPLYVRDCCRALESSILNPDLKGTFNLSGSERLSRFDFGRKVCQIYNFDEELIVPASVQDFSFRDGRPKDCSMRNEKIKEVVGFKFKSMKAALLGMKNF